MQARKILGVFWNDFSTYMKKYLNIVFSITPYNPLYSHLISVSKLTLPDTITTKNNTLHVVSSNYIGMEKECKSLKIW